MRGRFSGFAALAICIGALLSAADGCRAQDTRQGLPTTSGSAEREKTTVRPKKGQAPFVTDECPTNTKYVGGGADGSTRYCIFAEQKSLKRCETSYFEYIERDSNVAVSFDFRLDDATWDFHDVWTSIFQIHSPPDPGEQWRCPVAMLAVEGHSLEMWDRYDATPISVTKNGTCADVGNSIHSREVFTNVPIRTEQWNHFELQANLSLGPSGTFTVKLNNKTIGSLTGPNTFNDQHQPYLKVGIYKPSPWAGAKRLCVDYRNVSIKSGKN